MLNLNIKEVKNICLIAGFLCFFALFFAYFFLQKYLGLEPCPLCIVDRLLILISGITFIVMAFYNSLYLKLLLAISQLLLLLTTFRHFWLEHFPVEHTSCSPLANDLLQRLTNAFTGVSDCSVVSWYFAGLSIADMTLVFVVVISVVAFIVAFNKSIYAK